MRKVNTDRKENQEQDTQKKVNNPSKELKTIKGLLTISMVSQVIHQTNVGVMVKKIQ